jgi:hypothetical protein
MAFGGMEIGVVTRSQDYTIIKQNEDNKAFTDQVNIGQQVDKQTDRLTKEVNSSDNADWYEQKPDAKEKGNNEYRGDGGRKRKRQENSEQVVIKGRQSFDVKI